jgi:hypothetical protein
LVKVVSIRFGGGVETLGEEKLGVGGAGLKDGGVMGTGGGAKGLGLAGFTVPGNGLEGIGSGITPEGFWADRSSIQKTVYPKGQ